MNTLQSLRSIWNALAYDFGASTKSINTATIRSDGEGLNFFTVILPALGKDLDRSISTGQFICTSRFKLAPRRKTPAFLGELFVDLFDEEGRLVNYDSRKIKRLRQLLLMFYKLEVEFTESQISEAHEKFKAVDNTVKTDSWPSSIASVRKHFQSLLPDDPKDIRPHHSAGETADGYSNLEKREIVRFIKPLMKIFDLSYFFNSRDHALACVDLNRPLEWVHPPAKLTVVPKDSRGPRIICMEPHERMFIQKGVMQKLYDHIETDSPAKGYINFTDQETNRGLARRGSIDQSYSTIDLKDASDMVSWDLIKLLAPISWIAVLSATRSTHVCIGDELFEMKKFAPMGSALCFPIEAMLFWSIAKTVTDKVWVYGDDIICCSEDAAAVMSALEQYGLVINRDKSFTTGPFRESCGGEYVNGEDVSIVRLKSLELVSHVAFCNLITAHYGEETSHAIIPTADQRVSRTIIRREPIEYLDRAEPLVYYTSYTACNTLLQRRWNKHLQVFEVRSLMVTSSSKGQAEAHRTNALSRARNSYNFLFDWLTSVNTDSSPVDQEADVLYVREFTDPNYGLCTRNYFDNDFRLSFHQVPKPEIKFGWATTLVESATFHVA